VNRQFTSHQIAELVQVSPSAVLRWIDQGLLPAFRTPGGHRRVLAPALVEFLKAHQLPIPRQLATPVRVLVIDDEVRYLRSLGAVLRRTQPGLLLELTDSPVEGLLKVGLTRPNAVLLDWSMPGMDGLEVCRRIKAAPETRDIAVIAVTGRASPELEASFRKEGASGFLAKPLGAEQVLEALREAGVLPAEVSAAV
jgi:excisionase family DNA binding protein